MISLYKAAPPPHSVRHMEEAISSSPYLMRLMSDAVEQKLIKHIRLSPAEVNSGGYFFEKEKTIYINERDFIGAQLDNNSIDKLHDKIVSTIGHETSHAFDAANMERASRTLDNEIFESVRAAGGSEQREINLTELVREYLNTARDGEAKAERAGWNALASRIYEENGRTLNERNLLTRSFPTTRCVDKDSDGKYVLAPGLSMDREGRISANQREAVARCHFDASRQSLGQDGNASYRNYYAAYAIERIQDATRQWRNPPEVRLDMQDLGLDQEQIRGAGLDFGKPGRRISILDPATGIVTFEHNKNASSHATPDLQMEREQQHSAEAMSQELESSSVPANPFNDPAHPDHALYRNVQQSLQSQLPPGTNVSDDRLAQLTVAAKEARIQPDEAISVFLGETTLTLRGQHISHLTTVELAAPIPPAQDSAHEAADVDHERTRYAAQYAQEHAAREQQAPVMQH